MAPQRPTSPTSPRGTLERLFVYWLASTVLLAIGFTVVLFVAIGTRRVQLRALEDMNERLRLIEQRATAPVADANAPSTRPRSPTSPPARETQVQSTAIPGTRPAPSTTPAAPRPLSADDVLDRLERLAGAEAIGLDPAADPGEVEALIQECLEALPRASWPEGVWLRLAVLARAAGQESAADRFAGRISGAADQATYQNESARALLARGRFAEARAAAEAAGALDSSASNRVLLAATHAAEGDLANAAARLAQLPPADELSRRDRPVLAGVLLRLARWNDLGDLMNGVLASGPQTGPATETAAGGATEQDGDTALEPRWAFFAAVARAHDGRPAEALGILDKLAADMDGLSGESSSRSRGRWLRSQPTPYDIELWRGVSLLFANQYDQARAVLRNAAQQNAEDGTAHYYLGLLESRAGRPRLAEAHWRNAVAADPGEFTAWEGLAALLLEQGETAAALEHVGHALDIYPTRAAAHFLHALILAQMDRRDAAIGALARALALDPAYLPEAQHAEPLLQLISAEEMARLVSTGGSPPPAPGEPARERNE